MRSCVFGCLAGLCLTACGVRTRGGDETRAGPVSCEGVSIGNPAAVYCSMLGYKYSIQDINDGQIGICRMPDESICEAWEFLRGKCGQAYSWCAINGLTIQPTTVTEDSTVMEYAVCVDSNRTNVGKLTDLSGLQALLDSCK